MAIDITTPDVAGDADLASWAAITRAAGFDAWVATPTSANLRALITDEVGTGGLYFVGGALGTPASVTLTNATGLPVSTGLTGLGTGVATALGVNVGSAGAPVLFNGALGTPSSATLTNATGLPISTGVSGLGTGIATFLATPSSANLRAAVTDESGSGALLFAGGALGTPASGVLTNCTGLPSAGVITGTSGATIPLLNGANTWSAQQTIAAANPRFNVSNTNGTASQFQIGADSAAVYFGSFTNADVSVYANSAVVAKFLAAGGLEVGSSPVMTRGATETVTGAKTWTGAQTFQTSLAFTGGYRNLVFSSGNASAAIQPVYNFASDGSDSVFVTANWDANSGVYTSVIASAGIRMKASNPGQGNIVFYTGATGGAVPTLKAYVGLGLVVGAPTGGDVAAGAVNAQAVYDDNSLLTCYIVEAWKYGTIDLAKWDAIAPNREHPAEYETIKTGDIDAEGNAVTSQRLVKEAWTEVREHAPARGFAKVAADRLDIDKFAKFVWDNERLPAFPAPDRWADMYAGKMATGDLIQRLWETVEVMAVHSIDARKREIALTARIEALEASQ